MSARVLVDGRLYVPEALPTLAGVSPSHLVVFGHAAIYVFDAISGLRVETMHRL